MEVYNEKMERIKDPDFSRGRTRPGVRKVVHAAVEAVKEKWHYKTVREYPNGGRDIEKVVDVPGVEGKEAWVEEVPILIYEPMSEEELAAIEARKNAPTLEKRVEQLEESLRAIEKRLELAIGGMTQKKEREGT